jgi:hypothetical protein
MRKADVPQALGTWKTMCFWFDIVSCRRSECRLSSVLIYSPKVAVGVGPSRAFFVSVLTTRGGRAAVYGFCIQKVGLPPSALTRDVHCAEASVRSPLQEPWTEWELWRLGGLCGRRRRPRFDTESESYSTVNLSSVCHPTKDVLCTGDGAFVTLGPLSVRVGQWGGRWV